ncbi:MAG TPA: hypothetical protein VJ970_01830 [Flavobacteriaceae bacterium]|nr:hypothetical protein [Flavobacteriaceae bacterium]
MALFQKLFKTKPAIDTAAVLNQIDYKEGTLFAKDESNKVYVDIEELGGFPYLKTVIIGTLNVNVKRVGCTVSFIFNKNEITLESDNTTVASNEIKKTGIFYTPIDFELDDDEAQKLKTAKVKEVKFTFKNNTFSFNCI